MTRCRGVKFLRLLGERRIREDGAVFSVSALGAGRGSALNKRRNNGFRFDMFPIAVADAGCGAIITCRSLIPVISRGFPDVTLRESDLFYLLFERRVCKCGKVYAIAVIITGCCAYLPVHCRYGFGFNFSCIGFMSAGRGALIARRGFRPIIGRLIPFGYFRPFCMECKTDIAASRYIGSDFGNRSECQCGIVVPTVKNIAVPCGNGQNGGRAVDVACRRTLGERSTIKDIFYLGSVTGAEINISAFPVHLGKSNIMCSRFKVALARHHGVLYHRYRGIGSFFQALIPLCLSFHNAAVHRESTLVVYAVIETVNINISVVYCECRAVFKLDAVKGSYHRAAYGSAFHSYGRVNIMAVLAADQNLRSTAASASVTVDRRRVFYCNLCSVHNGDSAGFFG